VTRALVDVFAAAAVLLVIFFLIAAALTFVHARRRSKRQADLAAYIAGGILRDERSETKRFEARARLGAITMGDLVREPEMYAAALRAVRDPASVPLANSHEEPASGDPPERQ
jgi:hypothetical protein